MSYDRTSSRVAQRYIAKVFPNQEAMDKYLKDHPRANPSKHTVKGPSNGKGKAPTAPTQAPVQDSATSPAPEQPKSTPVPSSEPAPQKKPSPKPRSKPKSEDKPAPKTPNFAEMEVLGEGASRKVYEDGDTVVKKAKNEKAKKDNRTEVEASGKSDLLAPIVEHAPDYSWVRQVKLDKISVDELADKFGVSKADREKKYTVMIPDPWGGKQEVGGKDWLFAATHEARSGEKLVKSAGKYVEALKELKKNIPQLELDDFAYVDQWGKDKSGKPLIADYGFTNDKQARQVVARFLAE